MGRTAADAGRQVAGTAAEQAANVAQEVKAQARDLVGEARGQVQDQARAGQQKAAEGIRALSQELREMADGSQQSGTVSEIARQAAERADRLAEWLGQREPGDLLEEVAVLRPPPPRGVPAGRGALAGVVVGRLTRGAVDAARADSGPAPQRARGPRTPHPGTPAVHARLPAPSRRVRRARVHRDRIHRARRPLRHAARRSDTPTPPQGYPAPTPYPAASPLPPASAGPVGDLDPLDRPAPRSVGEYVDEVERPAGDAHLRRRAA